MSDDLPPPPPPPPPPPEGPISGPGGPRRPSGLPYPAFPPTDKSQLPAVGPGSPGVILPRVGARLFDAFLFNIPLGLWASRYVSVDDAGEQVGELPYWFVIFASLAPIVYEIAFLSWRGATLGKMLLKLQVVRYADGDMLLGYQAALRTLVWAVPLVLLPLVLPAAVQIVAFLVGIGILLSTILDPIYRGVHDKAAATIVLRTAEVRSRFSPPQ